MGFARQPCDETCGAGPETIEEIMIMGKRFKETLNKSHIVIASVAKQSRIYKISTGYGLPRRFTPRNDILVQRFLNAFILAAFFSVLAPCAYGELLAFGPELFAIEAGKSRLVTKDFSLNHFHHKYLVSILCEQSGCNGINAKITLNGTRIALPDGFKEHSMIAAPVNLKKKNRISVEAASKADAYLLVTIVSIEDHSVTAEIPPLGKIVSFEGYAEVTFPSDSFGTTQSVTITAAASPSIQQYFEVDAACPLLPYEIRINSGDKPPVKDGYVKLNMPDSLIGSNFEMQIYAKLHDNPEDPKLHDKFCNLRSGVNRLGKTVMTNLPKDAFSSRYSKDGTYEAIITVGMTHQ